MSLPLEPGAVAKAFATRLAELAGRIPTAKRPFGVDVESRFPPRAQVNARRSFGLEGEPNVWRGSWSRPTQAMTLPTSLGNQGRRPAGSAIVIGEAHRTDPAEDTRQGQRTGPVSR